MVFTGISTTRSICPSGATRTMPAKETAIPQIACGVDCRAVGQASREALQKRSLVRDRTRGQIVVIDPNSIGERVPEVEATLVRAPSQGRSEERRVGKEWRGWWGGY